LTGHNSNVMIWATDTH